MSRFPTTCVLLLVLVFFGCGDGGEPASNAEKMSEGHEGDTPTATEAAREPSVPVVDEEVEYTEVGGEVITGYLAVPASPDSVLTARGLDPGSAEMPGIVVVHEWWGLNDNVRTAARRLAGEEYRVLAVDLYGDSTAQTPDRAQSLMQQATSNDEHLLANLRGAHDYLQSEVGSSRVGVMGWCFGGGMTFRAVADRPGAFDAAVAYYGTPEAMTDAVLKTLRTPILAHFGRDDQVVPTKQVAAFRSRLKGQDNDVRIYEYDAGHAFANPSGENYNSEAASAAWVRTTDFLREHLYPQSG